MNMAQRLLNAKNLLDENDLADEANALLYNRQDLMDHDEERELTDNFLGIVIIGCADGSALVEDVHSDFTVCDSIKDARLLRERMKRWYRRNPDGGVYADRNKVDGPAERVEFDPENNEHSTVFDKAHEEVGLHLYEGIGRAVEATAEKFGNEDDRNIPIDWTKVNPDDVVFDTISVLAVSLTERRLNGE